MKKILMSLALAAPLSLVAPLSHAVNTEYRANLNGQAEATPNPSPGFSRSVVSIDADTLGLNMRVPFFDLTGGTMAAHIHCCTAAPLTGVAPIATMLPSFPDFPMGVTAGTYDRSFNLDDPGFYSPDFLSANGGNPTTAASALINGINANQAYLNVHTAAYPGGEIRGFLVSAIPEPGSWAMLGAGLAGLAMFMRRRT